jgi:hypothetical protein
MLDVVNLALPFFGLIFVGFACGRINQIPDTALGWMNFFISRCRCRLCSTASACSPGGQSFQGHGDQHATRRLRQRCRADVLAVCVLQVRACGLRRDGQSQAGEQQSGEAGHNRKLP